MRITADTNVLVRAAVADDPIQSASAAEMLIQAEVVAVPLPALCEFVWVLLKVYGLKPRDAADAIRSLVAAGNVATNLPAVESGLAVLDAGGDFADAVIAYEGQWLGADTFVSFDKKAVALLSARGVSTRLL